MFFVRARYAQALYRIVKSDFALTTSTVEEVTHSKVR